MMTTCLCESTFQKLEDRVAESTVATLSDLNGLLIAPETASDCESDFDESRTPTNESTELNTVAIHNELKNWAEYVKNKAGVVEESHGNMSKTVFGCPIENRRMCRRSTG